MGILARLFDRPTAFRGSASALALLQSLTTKLAQFASTKELAERQIRELERSDARRAGEMRGELNVANARLVDDLTEELYAGTLADIKSVAQYLATARTRLARNVQERAYYICRSVESERLQGQTRPARTAIQRAASPVEVRCPACHAVVNRQRDRFGEAEHAKMMEFLGVAHIQLKCPKCLAVMTVSE